MSLKLSFNVYPLMAFVKFNIQLTLAVKLVATLTFLACPVVFCKYKDLQSGAEFFWMLP